MSSWTSIVSTITSGLSGYTRLPDNMEAGSNNSTSHRDKGYSLKALQFDERQQTGGRAIGSYLIELKVTYISKNTSTYDTNIVSFESLLSTIQGLAHFAGIVSSKFEDINNKTTLATAQFYFGVSVIN